MGQPIDPPHEGNRRRRQSIPIWLTILIGVVAAIVGTLLANAIGVGDTRGSTGSS